MRNSNPSATPIIDSPFEAVRQRFDDSHLLGRMARVLSTDWEQAYGHPVYYLETFADPQRFRGTCYRAQLAGARSYLWFG